MSAFSGRTGDAPPVVVGHRGGRGEGWPAENTIEAFAQAQKEGAAAIELDVRTCATGEVVVLHDADLTRMTNGTDARKVAQVPLRELVRLTLKDGARIPTLAEVLEWASTRLAVNVELKRDVADMLTLARVAARTIREGRADVLISSFDPLLLQAVRALAPRVPRAFLTLPRARPVVPPLGIHAVHLEREQATGAWVLAQKERGLKVGVWTVNDPVEAKDLAFLGVDWLITDAPGSIVRGLRMPDV